MKFITTTKNLDLFIDEIIADDTGHYIALDTEFVRINTYWPQLCLVQIAGSKQAAIIDCLAENIDLTPLKKLLYTPDIIKVLHSARQDLEIFYKLFEEVPYPLFDTQVADSFCGDSESIGFERIAEKLLSRSIDKTCQFTDWAQRPLSSQQIEYALNDVVYLREIYEILRSDLVNLSRLEWVYEESERMYMAESFIVDPAKSWKRVKSSNKDARFWARVKELAAWREQESQRKNVNRGKIMKDDVLSNLCLTDINNPLDIIKIIGLPSQYKTPEYIEIFTQMLKNADSTPGADCPNKFIHGHLTGMQKEKLKEILNHADEIAKELNVPRSLLGNKDDIIKMMLTGKNQKLQKGWRKEVFTQKVFG